MKRFVFFILFLFSVISFADPQKVFIKSNNAKLYQVLRLIDDRSQWLKASELLREILASDVRDPFIRKQLNLAKKEIDAEAVHSVFRYRVLDRPFIVAKLRITEALMANHARLNISYDQEASLIKGLLQTYFFPGEEDKGEIIFPEKNTYSFDVYGYIKENILKTETAPSGVIEDPRFPDVQKQVKEKLAQLEGQVVGKSNTIKPEDVKEIIDGLKIIIGEEASDLFTIVRLQNQYEPWAMLMQAIANPDSVNEDPQLRDFLKGVKLKFKVGDFPYMPKEQAILKDILASPSKDVGVTLEEEIHSDTGKMTLYVVSNLSGPDMLHYKFFIYLKNFVELYPHAKTAASKIGSSSVVSSTITFVKYLKNANIYRVLFGVAQGVLVPESAPKVVQTMMSEAAMIKPLKQGRFAALLKNSAKWTHQHYFHIALVLIASADMAEGTVRYLSAMDKYDRLEAWQTTLSKELATFLYALPLISQRAIFKYVGWTTFAFDFGHLFDRMISQEATIPPMHRVIKRTFGEYIPDRLSNWLYGGTVKTWHIKELEEQIGIDDEEASSHLATLVLSANQASSVEELTVIQEIFAHEMKMYANKRLFIMYYFIQRWNNNTVRELGEMEQKYWDDYQKYKGNVKTVNGMFEELIKSFK